MEIRFFTQNPGFVLDISILLLWIEMLVRLNFVLFLVCVFF